MSSKYIIGTFFISTFILLLVLVSIIIFKSSEGFTTLSKSANKTDKLNFEF